MRPDDAYRGTVVTVAMLASLLGCSSEDTVGMDPSSEPDLSPLGGDRPVEPIVPEGFDPTVPTPLVLLLHGYAASGLSEDIILKLDTMVDEHGFIYLRPDGTFDSEGRRFWNATDACCNFDGVELAELWAMEGEGHLPNISDAWRRDLFDFLLGG